MSTVLPYSMDLSRNPSSMNSDIESNISRIRSDGISYAGSDTMSFTIPTSNSSNFLHPTESFLELKFKPTFTVAGGGSGKVFLDSNAYALIDAVRVYHGSQLLFSTNNVAPLWIALRDTVSNSLGDSIDLGCSAVSANAGGMQLTTVNTFGLSMCLPIPVLGSMSGAHSIPLNLANSGDIVLELDLNPAVKVMCCRTNLAVGAGSTSAAALTSYLLTDCYYNMKTSRLPSQISNALKNSYGDIVRFSGQSWASEKVSVAAGSTSVSCRLPFRFSSLKGIVWFLQNAAVANGVLGPDTFTYQQACGTRCGGKLNQYWVSVDGRDYPSSHVVTSLGSATVDGTIGFYGSPAYSQLKRMMNTLPNGNVPTVLDRTNYNLIACLHNDIEDSAIVPKFVGALDLDRADQSEEIYQGINTRNANLTFSANWDASIGAETMNLCIYGLYDISFEIMNGQITPYF